MRDWVNNINKAKAKLAGLKQAANKDSGSFLKT
jgi:hypothetical protein